MPIVVTVGMILLVLVALAALGFGVFEAVTTAKGISSPKFDWLRRIMGPITVAVLALWGIKRMNDMRKQAACKRIDNVS